jgi:hypothetical protein
MTPFHDARYPSRPHDTPLPAWTVLVAFAVNGESFIDAQRRLMARLPDPESDGHAIIDGWWIAEDERVDGSDNDSAIFVPKGTQVHALDALDCARRLP